MSFCWAAAHSPCKGRSSGEHVVSACLFSKAVRVHGYHWCPTPKTVGTTSLVANVLCGHHNSGLSELDTEAKSYQQAVTEAGRLLGVRSAFKRPGVWNRITLNVEGPLLERWFLKTLVNSLIADGAQCQWHGSSTVSPPMAYVSWAFDGASLPAPSGLYGSADLDRTFQFGTDFILGLTPIFEKSGHVAGGLFEFLGFRWILWLLQTPFPTADIPYLQPAWEAQPPMFHLVQYDFRIGKNVSHSIRFRW